VHCFARWTPLFPLIASVRGCRRRALHLRIHKLVAHMKEYEKAERGEPFEGVRDGIFLGYVTGVIDTLGDALCLPDDVSNRQVTAIAAKYLNGHPEQWNQPAPQLVMRAMRAAFPCR